MTTKEKILNEALTLFAEKGYNAVSVGDIATAVGIKAPSLYKHYKSKQDIFNAIVDKMEKNYNKQAVALKMNGNDFNIDANIFSSVSEDTFIQMGIGLFQYFLHDNYACKFRKMLTIEQFHDNELSILYSKQYIEDPLSYQSSLLALISTKGLLKQADSNIMALHFYSPIYMLLTVCDRHPERESEALQLIEKHIRQFNDIYKGEKIQ